VVKFGHISKLKTKCGWNLEGTMFYVEYRTMIHGACKLRWLKRYIEEMEFSYQLNNEAICDNKTAKSVG